MSHSPLDRVIELVAQMPGIGRKTAQRLAYFILNRGQGYAGELANALMDLSANVRWCRRCYNLSQAELCTVCSQTRRDANQLCVVEDAANLATIERSGGFRGYYHVLQGVLSPVNGIGPDELRIAELTRRVEDGEIKEVILATNPTVEGEATAMYIAGLLEHTQIVISRIGVGVPIGGSLDYCDEVTMTRAIENRRRPKALESSNWGRCGGYVEPDSARADPGTDLKGGIDLLPVRFGPVPAGEGANLDLVHAAFLKNNRWITALFDLIPESSGLGLIVGSRKLDPKGFSAT